MDNHKNNRKAKKAAAEAESQLKKETLSELNDVICALKHQFILFDSFTEPELIEECIYNINSMQARYAFLLKKAKELGIENLSVFTPQSGTKH